MGIKEKIKATYKSGDTEEWLDTVWTRPLGYLWALLFRRLGVHPNAVTVLSMIIGASSALFFVHGSWRTEGTEGLLMNIIAILLLSWANIYDSADGQLARMTGKKTRLGRILDGAASEVWFIPIYIALVCRFYNHHDMEFSWMGLDDTSLNAAAVTLILFVTVLYSGFVCHSGQCGIADYYRQIHLFFLKGEQGSELDSSAARQKDYDTTPWKGNVLWKLFLKTYINYTKKQERQTPAFGRLLHTLEERYGSTGSIPRTIREAFLAGSLPLMKYTNILTFNTRAIALYVCCLADLPWAYFVFEIVFMGALCAYMRWRHEDLCDKLYDWIEKEAPDD